MPEACVGLELDDELHLLVLRGPIPLQEMDTVLAKARQAAGGSAAVSVDLSEVEHMHVACVQVLLALRIHVEAQQRHFSVRAPSDSARRALRLAGLRTWFDER